MLRKTMIALLAVASFGMLAPDVASARGGFGGGGFHGGGFGGGGFHGGGFRGGFGSGGFHAGPMVGGFHSAAIGGGFGRGAMIGGGPRFSHAAMIGGGPRFSHAAMIGGGGGFVGHRFHGGFHHGFHHRRFPFGAFAAGVGLGLYAPYAYYGDYGYDYPYYAASYYDDGGCYIVRRRVLTPWGWRIRRATVCG